MSTGIAYNNLELGPLPLTNNLNCDCTLYMGGNYFTFGGFANPNANISANNISIRNYRNAFNIPVKRIVDINGDYIYYFLEGDVIDWDLSLIEATPVDNIVHYFTIGSTEINTVPYTITSLDIGNGVDLQFQYIYNNLPIGYSFVIVMFTNYAFKNYGTFVLEPEYVTILENINNANQPLIINNAIIRNHNQFIKNLKAAGIWDKLDVLYVFALGGDGIDPIYDYFRTLNWKNPDLYQATLINSFNRDAKGLQRLGSSLSYIDTNFIPSINGVNYTLNNASRYTYRYMVSTGYIDGTVTGNNNLNSSSLSNANRINSTNTLSSSIATNASAVSINRLSSTSVKLSNGNTISNRTQTSTTLSSESQLILRSSGSYGSHRISIYAMGAALSDSEIIAFNNAAQTLLNAI